MKADRLLLPEMIAAVLCVVVASRALWSLSLRFNARYLFRSAANKKR